MFETAELGQKVDQETYNREAPEVRAALLEAQRELADAEPLRRRDRHRASAARGNRRPSTSSSNGSTPGASRPTRCGTRPRRSGDGPRCGGSGANCRRRAGWGSSSAAWYAQPIVDRVFGRSGGPELDQSLDRIVELERMLHREGVLIVKFWLHLSKKAQKKRIKRLEADPRQRWRIFKRDWKLFRHYDAYRSVGEHVLRRTGSGEAPWHIVEGADRRYRHLTVARTLLEALRSPTRPGKADAAGPEAGADPPLAPGGQHHQSPRYGALRSTRRSTRRSCSEAQGELGLLTRRLRKEERSLDPRLRGARRGGQRRGDPPADRRDGRPRLSGRHRGRPDRRGAGPPLPLAVLAGLAAAGPGHDLRPIVVRPGAGRAASRGSRPPTSGSGPSRRSTPSRSS